MEKHYTEFACDYCKYYPCSRFNDDKKGKIVMNNCGDFKEDEDLSLEENKNEENDKT